MSPAAVVLVALAALLVGFVLGQVYVHSRALVALTEAPVSASLPLPSSAAPGIRERFVEPARDVARAWLGTRGETPDEDEVNRLAPALSALAADGWAMGATDLRAELAASSGLPAEVIDYASANALSALEARGAG